MRRLPAAIAVASALIAMSGHAWGQTASEAPCEMREISVYFDTGSADITPASAWVAQRLASDAKACGDASVVVHAPQGSLHERRAQSLIRTFASLGVDVQLAPSPKAVAGAMADRVARVQLAPAAQALS